MAWLCRLLNTFRPSRSREMSEAEAKRRFATDQGSFAVPPAGAGEGSGDFAGEVGGGGKREKEDTSGLFRCASA